MPKKRSTPATERATVPTEQQVSAGGVAFRRLGSKVEVAIVSVKPSLRWQLPKGLIDPGETPEVTAVREVREEAGIETQVVDLIQIVEYWYRGEKHGAPVRYHKFVHFYLLSYVRGDVNDHDYEVAEARWMTIDEAIALLAFKSEKDVVAQAKAKIQ